MIDRCKVGTISALSPSPKPQKKRGWYTAPLMKIRCGCSERGRGIPETRTETQRSLNGSPTRLLPCWTPSVSRPRLSDWFNIPPLPHSHGPEPRRQHRSQKDYADVPDVNVTYFEVPQKPEDMAVSAASAYWLHLNTSPKDLYVQIDVLIYIVKDPCFSFYSTSITYYKW